MVCSAPSHYLNQCWLIVKWTPRKKLQWNSNQNTKVFIHEKAFECVGCEMAAILSRERWVNWRLTWMNFDFSSIRSKGSRQNSHSLKILQILIIKTHLKIWMSQWTLIYRIAKIGTISYLRKILKSLWTKGKSVCEPEEENETWMNAWRRDQSPPFTNMD